MSTTIVSIIIPGKNDVVDDTSSLIKTYVIVRPTLAPLECYFTEEKIRNHFYQFGDQRPIICSNKIGSKAIKNLRIIFPDHIFEKNKNQCWTMRKL